MRLTARATISHKSQLQWYSRRAERADWADLAEDLWFHAYPDLDDKTLAAGQPADRLKAQTLPSRLDYNTIIYLTTEYYYTKGKHCICKMYAEYINLYSTCGLAEEMSGEEKVSQPATSSCGNVSTV